MLPEALMRVLSVFLAAIMMPLSLLTSGLDLALKGGSTPADSVDNIAGFSTLLRTQGLTTDGEYFYFSSKTTLVKTSLDGRTLRKANLSAISDELKDEYGIKHIGGISFYDGSIYCGMEDSKVWKSPVIGVFDSETLEMTSFYEADEEQVTRGVPWVAVNPSDGVLYLADHSKKPSKLMKYNAKGNMEYLGSVDISESIPSIQGGEFFDGMLYVATNDDTKSIRSIDPVSGECRKIIDRTAHSTGEGEGMTILLRDNEPYIYAFDLGTIFINVFIRSYKLSDHI